ncbi:proton-dependent oligopeptide transporter, POT family [Nocardia amikacinitolerans]|uniref:Proton-dependent oligopeptide transporter, POT family n=1 Tax=Nocardia amikacinitolerans TaxID=756689 RepID=A0A285L7N1_9NOCA|nr:oligopeptide:H+ symporter [Nocardia amikacinitolerans]MCP2275114.1 proton-dependent oligopeptide transporter, POT family [Nocardia amikacinitolerans]MCP2296146.1 proton-dependent oligopeptide transporter, POT family [Nocardia amikacinitolerans]MCP2316421.1 proton-dependent oligopeptide transporter, POT family [Nocardia amikacinitolerans]SNY80902.1 proton-dependent oligopeptide transporter, POT family [Nocardia amikacinitolerans]
MSQVVESERPIPARTLFGHPIGLANLFGVELWERFSFYGMVTILGYYLYYSVTDGGLGLEQSTGVGIVGAYGGLVYLSTVLGGWIADRLLGMERTVFYGGVVVMAGHIALAVLPGLAGVGVGLVLVALGSGALKANASSLLGTLYPKDDARIDGGFTLFYLGINIGAFTGPLLTGLLQTHLGFHYGFGAAAIGMALGLTQYVVFRRNLGNAGREVPNPLPRSAIWPAVGVVLGAAVVVVVAFATGLVTLESLPEATTVVIAVASLGYFAVMLTSAKVAPVERSRVRAFIPLFLANAVFWSLFQQIFTVLAVYSDERMNWSIFGWTAPSSWIGSVEPVWIITLSPLFALLWTKLGNRAPSTPRKFALGVVGMGLSFLLFVPLAGFDDKSVPALAVLVIMAGFAVSELLLSPIGLAVTTQLAPEAFRAQMMALYFFSVGIGTSMSGVLARFYAPEHEVAYFGITGAVAITVGLIVAALGPWISRYMAGVH